MALRRDRNRAKVDDDKVSGRIEAELDARAAAATDSSTPEDLDDLDTATVDADDVNDLEVDDLDDTDDGDTDDGDTDDGDADNASSGTRAARSRREARAERRSKPSREARRARRERDKLDATPPWQTRRAAERVPTTGPYDAADEPDDDIERVNLGVLRLPGAAGLDLRVDVENGAALSATFVHPGGHMQIGAFAAPRTEGIWDEVREEIRSSIGTQRGTVQQVEGPFGAELTGTLPGPAGPTKVRFVGVDGPRWFVRAMLVGAPASDPKLGETFERILRNVVVARGNDPMPVREPIPLTLPDEVLTHLTVSGDQAE